MGYYRYSDGYGCNCWRCKRAREWRETLHLLLVLLLLALAVVVVLAVALH